MAILRKFKKLHEIELKDVDVPDYVVVTYAVCAIEDDACGWGGWMIEAAFQNDNGRKHKSITGDRVLPGAYAQICPICGKETFRTAASIVMEPSKNKKLIDEIMKVEYEVIPIEYND